MFDWNRFFVKEAGRFPFPEITSDDGLGPWVYFTCIGVFVCLFLSEMVQVGEYGCRFSEGERRRNVMCSCVQVYRG